MCCIEILNDHSDLFRDLTDFSNESGKYAHGKWVGVSINGMRLFQDLFFNKGNGLLSYYTVCLDPREERGASKR